MIIKSKMFKSWNFVIAVVLVGGVLFLSPGFAGAKEIKEPAGEPVFKMETLFREGDVKSKIRLPKIVVANDGTLIAFPSLTPFYRVSKDKGETWSDIKQISPECQGGTIIVDRITGDILVLDPRPDAVLWRSKDTAKTWKSEKAKFRPNRGDFGGSGGSENGITLMHGKYKGRLIIPSRFMASPKPDLKDSDAYAYHYNSVYYSDDRGKTWQAGEPVQSGTGEAAVVGLSDGSVYINSRAHIHCDDRRRIAWSYDGGETFVDWSASDELFETSGTVPNLPNRRYPSYGTSAGLARMPDGATEYDDVLIFGCANEKLRYERFTVPKTENLIEWTKVILMVSYDGENNWPEWRYIPHEHACAYVSVAADKDGMIYVLFERTIKAGKVDYVDFVKCNLAWIHQGHTIRIAELLEKAASNDMNIRRKAWAKLSKDARPSDIKPVMAVVARAKTRQGLSYAEGAVRNIFSRANNRSEFFQTIADYYADATETTKGFILSLGTESGDAFALKLEQKALASGNKNLYARALEALANWPNEQAVSDLYRQARKASEKTDRNTALGGYVRIAGLESAKLSNEERMAMMRKAIRLASSDEEKKHIISNLQNVLCAESLQALQEYMADASLRDEAQSSALKLAWKLRKYNSDEAIAMAKKLTKSNNATIAAEAGEVLDKLEKGRAYIQAWKIAGPYKEEGKKGDEVFKTVYPPESGDKEVDWKKLTYGVYEDKVDLEQTFGRMNYTAIYVKTTLISPADQDVLLEMGSDDGIKAWLNGELVHSNFRGRPCVPGSDVKTVKLRKGKNKILLKIVNITSGWEFSCRLRQQNGKHIKGLIVEP